VLLSSLRLSLEHLEHADMVFRPALSRFEAGSRHAGYRPLCLERPFSGAHAAAPAAAVASFAATIAASGPEARWPGAGTARAADERNRRRGERSEC